MKSCVISFPISATSPPMAFEERRWLLFVRCPGEEKVLFLLYSFSLSRLTIVSKRTEDQAATSFSFSTDGEVTAKSSLASKVPLQSKSLHQTPSSHNLNIEVRPCGVFQLYVSKDLPSFIMCFLRLAPPLLLSRYSVIFLSGETTTRCCIVILDTRQVLFSTGPVPEER